MGSDPERQRMRRATLESQLRFPGRWAISFMFAVTLGYVVWGGTTWVVGALWGVIIGGVMWIYSRSARGRRATVRRIERLDDSH